ncbi:Histidine kinase-like ATPase domain-containing protein [Streptomyces sp. SceaMP-e96]|uniref:ATP-binding protein n=1 Tax=Streptomyces TaxID=1883 RepID=UPI000823BCB6|nr:MULTISPECIES: ATP-binding protein [unclassified Streptomyces]MYT17465.1 ATP-binding protein [Streptomyces sp. SID4951]SCK42383.1 Histidine kinase-like ATPase domain-containing protein [Streptomyces sp. SceaMP-e96]
MIGRRCPAGMAAAALSMNSGGWPAGGGMNSAMAMEAVIEHAELHSSVTLASDDLAPRRARAFTRTQLTEWGLDALADRVLLIVSELVTNACRHGRTKPEGLVEEITLTLSYQNAVVGIELEDNSRQLPVPRKGPISALDGRGLCLVAAEADAWTSRLNPDGTGKRVLAFLRWPSTPPAV